MQDMIPYIMECGVKLVRVLVIADLRGMLVSLVVDLTHRILIICICMFE